MVKNRNFSPTQIRMHREGHKQLVFLAAQHIKRLLENPGKIIRHLNHCSAAQAPLTKIALDLTTEVLLFSEQYKITNNDNNWIEG